MSVTAYQRTRNTIESPRATEHRLMSQITRALIEARDSQIKGAKLAYVLHWNREAWSTFSTLCADSDNKLPASLRASLISLSLWVDRHSSEIMAGRADLDDLIDVNRMIMDGLISS
jgi:flagellar protein FlaF